MNEPMLRLEETPHGPVRAFATPRPAPDMGADRAPRRPVRALLLAGVVALRPRLAANRTSGA